MSEETHKKHAQRLKEIRGSEIYTTEDVTKLDIELTKEQGKEMKAYREKGFHFKNKNNTIYVDGKPVKPGTPEEGSENIEEISPEKRQRSEEIEK